jgi:hypothetical protein
MDKGTKFFNQLVDYLQAYYKNDVKNFLGDSTDNHRVLSTNQVINFLTLNNSLKLNKLGRNLKVVYSVLRPQITYLRRLCNERTDAIDINEFIYTFEYYYSSDPFFRKALSKRLN